MYIGAYNNTYQRYLENHVARIKRVLICFEVYRFHLDVNSSEGRA